MHEKLFSLTHILITTALALGVGLALGANFFSQTIVAREGTADTPAAMTSVNVMVDDGSVVRTWNTVTWHEAQSVLTLMQEIADTGNITLNVTPDGAGIGAINETANTDTLRWQYWVNNNHEPVPANKYYVKPGDLVMWKYVAEQKQ